MSRINSIVDALGREKYQLMIASTPTEYMEMCGINENTVSIIDNGETSYDYVHPKTILVTDEKELHLPKVSKLVINTIHKEFRVSSNCSRLMDIIFYTGLEHAIVTPNVLGHVYSAAYGAKSNNIALIPGGRKDFFLDKVDEIVATAQSAGLGDYHFHVLGGLSQSDLFEEVCASRLTICTPSVVSLELIAMGVPIMLIQTAEDQSEYLRRYKRLWATTNDSPQQEIINFLKRPKPLNAPIGVFHSYRLAQHLYNFLWRS